MVLLQVTGQRAVTVRAPKEKVFALVKDVQKTGKFFPGIDDIKKLADDKFEWFIAERKSVGITFRGHYITQYQFDEPHEVRFETVEGNMKTRGVWRLSGPDGSVRVHLEVHNEIEVPVPRLAKKIATAFANHEVSNGIEKQLNNFKASLEV